MTKKKHTPKLILLLIASILISIAACKSTPEPKPEPPKPTVEKPVGVEKEAIDARNKAVAQTADTLFPEEFAAADARLHAGKEAKKAGSTDTANAAFANARDNYLTLANLAASDADRKKIEQNGFAQYAQEDYDKFLAAYNEAREKYHTNPQRALEASEEAAMYAAKVKNAGFMHLSKDAKSRADAAKNKCDSVKAQKSETSRYNAAVTSYSKAKQAAEKEDYETVYLNYISAADSFEKLYTHVAEKRAKALEAMRLAKEQQEKSAKLAREADKEAPLDEDPEGQFSTEPIDVSGE